MHRTVRECDTFVTNLRVLVRPLFRVCLMCGPTNSLELCARKVYIDGRISFEFDLPLLLIPSVPCQSRNFSHTYVLVHFRCSTNRTSWSYGSLYAHEALLADLPWMPMQG